MGLCLFKTEASNYKLQKSNLQFKLMQNMQERDSIKERLDRGENRASEMDSYYQKMAADGGYTYNPKTTYVQSWHDSAEYKHLIAEDNELDIENASIDTELEYINSMIETFDKGQENEIKNSGLWCYGG